MDPGEGEGEGGEKLGRVEGGEAAGGMYCMRKKKKPIFNNKEDLISSLLTEWLTLSWALVRQRKTKNKTNAFITMDYTLLGNTETWTVHYDTVCLVC